MFVLNPMLFRSVVLRDLESNECKIQNEFRRLSFFMMNYFIITYGIYFRIYFWPREIHVLNGTYYSFYIQFTCYRAKLLSRVQFCVTPWTLTRQAPVFMGFSKQEKWSGLPFPSPWNLPDRSF